MATTPRALIHNWRLKASALGLSVFLWALVQTEPRSEETFSAVPIQLDISDTAWTASSPPRPATVELRLDGPAREIIRLAREGTTLHVPIDYVGSTDTVITLRRDWVDLGQRSGLVVESVSPSVISVSFEPAESRSIPVAMRVQGRVREHLALATAIVVSPKLIRVRGPASVVLALDSIPLEAFDLSRVTASGSYSVAVDTSSLSGATVAPSAASLGVQVEDMVQRVLDVRVSADVPPGEAEVVIEPTTIQLTLTGARTLVMAIDPSVLRVWVPPEFLEGMEPGEERGVNVYVDGVPALVTAVPGTRLVTARRAIDLTGDPEEGGR